MTQNSEEETFRNGSSDHAFQSLELHIAYTSKDRKLLCLICSRGRRPRIDSDPKKPASVVSLGETTTTALQAHENLFHDLRRAVDHDNRGAKATPNNPKTATLINETPMIYLAPYIHGKTRQKPT